MARRIVVMGVSGSGKSTLGRALATTLGLPFVEGDALHPPANIGKMARGEPLDDLDREPFLANVAASLEAHGDGVVVACSALRRRYRDRLRAQAGDITFLLPIVDRETLARRLAARPGHFMPASLLDSQLATLEPLQPDEHGLAFDGSAPLPQQLQQLIAALGDPG